MKISRKTAAILSGLVWFAIGFYLLSLGLRLIMSTLDLSGELFLQAAPLLKRITPLAGGRDLAAVCAIALGLAIGYGKGRAVLRKVAVKGVNRLQTMAQPLPIYQMYAPKTYLLIGLMMLLGMGMNFLGVPNDVRGLIDVAVGSGLIQGAIGFFAPATQDSTTADHL